MCPLFHSLFANYIVVILYVKRFSHAEHRISKKSSWFCLLQAFFLLFQEVALSEAHPFLSQAFVWLCGTLVTTTERPCCCQSRLGWSLPTPFQNALRPEAAAVSPAPHSVLPMPLHQTENWLELGLSSVWFCFSLGLGHWKSTLAVVRDWAQQRAGHSHVHLGTRQELGPHWAFEDRR